MRSKKPHTRGIDCPDCRGFRLFVVKTTRACRGLVRRRLECSVCGLRFCTEERLARVPNPVTSAALAASRLPGVAW